MNTGFMSLVALIAGSTIASAEPAGYETFSVMAPHHGRGMIGAIWYPSMGDGRAFEFASNAVFHGVTVVEEATLAGDAHPVVLLSHGMGGNIRSLAWLATQLAESGAIVVSVNHPNSTWGDFDIAVGLQHWTRAQDLSLALDTLLEHPRFADAIDETRIMAAGFSYGWWTALSMGGVRGNHAGYVDHCATYDTASSHCADLAQAGVAVADISESLWNASYADPRITHVTAVDPGLIWGLSAADMADVIPDVHLIGLGQGEDRWVAVDFDQSGFASLIQDVQSTVIAPATHFTAIPLCKPMGAAILAEEQDDPVCTDPEGTDRAAVHRKIIGYILEDLGL